jgi:hypothetical protein
MRRRWIVYYAKNNINEGKENSKESEIQSYDTELLIYGGEV